MKIINARSSATGSGFYQIDIQRTLSSTFKIAFGLAALLCMCLPAGAALVWDEEINGDLSGDPAAPTPLAFSRGSNVVSGSMGLGGDGRPDDVRDYLTFTVADDQLLVALLLLEYVDIDSSEPGNRGFHAINLGASSFIPGQDTADNFLGGDHLDPAPPGTDLLPDLAAATLAGTGFTIPLGPGTYSYVVQQTGQDFTGYQLDFNIAVIPIPGAAWLYLSSVGLLAGWRRFAGS